jgi:hypothetical protein
MDAAITSLKSATDALLRGSARTHLGSSIGGGSTTNSQLISTIHNQATAPFRALGLNIPTIRPEMFGDFIARPGQPVATFSPDDTVIGVKDTGMFGGGTNVQIGSINVTGYDKDPQELAYEVAVAISRELNAR